MKFLLTKTTVAFVFLILMTTNVFADDKVSYLESNTQNGIPISRVKDSSDAEFSDRVIGSNSYINSAGTVQKVLYLDDLVRIMTKLDNGEIVGINVYPQTPVYYYDTRVFSVDEGDRIVAGYKKDAIISKGIGVPKQIDVTAVVVINPTKTYTARIDRFSKTGANGYFTAGFDDYTLYYDLQGNLISKEKTYEKDLIVIYENIYGENPSKVTALKIISLDLQNTIDQAKLDKANAFIDSLGAEQTIIQNDLKYIRLSDLASYYGYDIGWDASSKSATVLKGDDRYIVSLNNVEYLHNDSLCYLANQPFLSGGRIYVESKFAVNFIVNIPQ